jgi:hypothetical protein
VINPEKVKESIQLEHFYQEINKIERISDVMSIWDKKATLTKRNRVRLYAETGIEALFRLQLIDFTIKIPKRFLAAEFKNALWPLYSQEWIDELPKSIRSLLLIRHSSKKIKSSQNNGHRHLEATIFCFKCRNSKETVNQSAHDQNETLNRIKLETEKQLSESLKNLEIVKGTAESIANELSQVIDWDSSPIQVLKQLQRLRDSV